MVIVEFMDWRGKVDFLPGEVTRKGKDGFYILSFGEEYYIANSRVLGLWRDKAEESNNDGS